MSIARVLRGGLLVSAAAVLGLASSASATVYTDATGDNYGGPEVDISNVVVTNDANNITFQINMNPSANIGTNYYADYEIGIQTGGGVGGQPLINATYGTGNPAAGNPYGSNVGISTGENFFIGSYLDEPTVYSGGAQLYSYSLTGGWSQVGATAPITDVYTGTPSTTFTFPLSALGLSPGSSFNFDVWTTFSGGQGAYDALDNITGTPNGVGGAVAPYSGGSYDSATAGGSTFASTVYTVAVPEPASIGLIGIAALAMLKRRSR